MRVIVSSTYILAPRSETPPSGTPPLLPIPLPTSAPHLLSPSNDCRADVLKDPDEIAEEIPATDVAELSQRMTNFVTTIRHDTYEIYKRLDDAQDDRLLMSGQLNLLRKDRHSHARTARLLESEARASREAWTEIGDLWAADRRRESQLTKALTLLRILQTQMIALQSQQRPARDPTHPNVPKEASSSS
uniref:Uncharacterized protein n=1 Tax=Tanacetum cinerariifolium TaxID=118510 RepID=A0A699JE57_TANCI|nr:hypothetical protein [Tanacetum cinerariifolium]GFA31405.1 hypothetical protein [Tanacetum cinerariifolium]